MFFSVIVPIYNVESYLEKCIESVLRQSFADFELILVDDGSTDGCPQLCDSYKDSRIKVIHKNNGGLVSARQAGIKIASGEYIVNLDGDDSLLTDMLEKAYKIIAETDADIVSFSHLISSGQQLTQGKCEPIAAGLYHKKEIESTIYPRLLLDKSMKHMLYFLCGKAIRRSLITEPQLNVDKNISLGEDLCCMIPCYLSAEKVFISNENAFLYTTRNDSISKAVYPTQLKKVDDIVDVLHSLNSGAVKDFSEQMSRYYAFMCFAIIAAAAEHKCFSDLKEIKSNLITSSHRTELKKAKFGDISAKSRISIWLIKKNLTGAAFYFLYICGVLKNIIRR